jgi:hypothetical protein
MLVLSRRQRGKCADIIEILYAEAGEAVQTGTTGRPEVR